MVELYPLIIKASVAKCPKTAWELVLQFKPYIRRACFNEEKRFLDEDMVSDVILRLHKRILGFEVRTFSENERQEE